MEDLILRINPQIARRYLQAANFYFVTDSYLDALKKFEGLLVGHEKEGYSETPWIYAKFKKPNLVLKTINRINEFFPTFTKRIAFVARAQFLLGIYLFYVKDDHGKLIITDFKRV